MDLDTIAMREIGEFSQEGLGEAIVSHRVLSGGLNEAMDLAKFNQPQYRWQFFSGQHQHRCD